MQWLCKPCRAPGAQDVGTRTRLEAKMDAVLMLVTSMEERLAKIEGTHSKDGIEKLIEETVQRKVAQVFEETQEREKRKNNIIVVNLAESQKEEGADRKQDDIEAVKKLLTDITDETTASHVENPIRLGQFKIGTNTRPRLLKLTVTNDEDKKKIMRNVKNLNRGVEDAANRVYINNDCTPKEREDYKALKTELDKRRADDKDNDWIIRGNQIVKRRPPMQPSGESQGKQGN